MGAGILALAGCSSDDEADRPDSSSGRPGPIVTPTAAPAEGAAPAERYKKSGGQTDVYSVETRVTPDGDPLVIVRSREARGENFEELDRSLIRFLKSEGLIAPKNGYLLDVFGPEGKIKHRWDTTP
ncbi:hypothetical protein ACN20G_01620 [Streptomyces sp. BI20]|uniref:hypothetical protein n=1 Tax=Streptomyces sp. BI20 TaxID=3403460 RepID=UPI003C731534